MRLPGESSNASPEIAEEWQSSLLRSRLSLHAQAPLHSKVIKRVAVAASALSAEPAHHAEVDLPAVAAPLSIVHVQSSLDVLTQLDKFCVGKVCIMPGGPSSVVAPVIRPGAPSSFLLLVVRPGAPSSVLAPSSNYVTIFHSFPQVSQFSLLFTLLPTTAQQRPESLQAACNRSKSKKLTQSAPLLGSSPAAPLTPPAHLFLVWMEQDRRQQLCNCGNNFRQFLHLILARANFTFCRSFLYPCPPTFSFSPSLASFSSVSLFPPSRRVPLSIGIRQLPALQKCAN